MKIVIDSKSVEFTQIKTWWDITIHLLKQPVQDITGITPIYPSFNYKGIKKYFQQVTHKELGKTIRFSDKDANVILGKHIQRLTIYNVLSTAVYFFATIVFGLVLISVLSLTAGLLNLNGIDGFSGVFTIGLSFPIALFAMRIVVIIFDKHFADTLAVLSCFYLLISLEQANSLSEPENRRTILQKIRILKRNIVMLPRTLSAENDPWAYKHFKQMENYVRVREQWAIAPQKQTLDDLRKDFSYLLEILISGQYGNFRWEQDEKTVETQPSKAAGGFVNEALRLLLTIFPFILMAFFFIAPDVVTTLGIDRNTYFLIAIAWALLLIDSRLNLGIAERATRLAKTMKDLR